MSTALSIEGLKISYGSVDAVKSIDIAVQEGQIVTLLGANGAGKTSTLRAISGLVPASAGTITYQGQNITNLDAEKIASLGISQVPEGRQIFPDLTVEENLKAGSFTVKSKKRIAERFRLCYDYFPRLLERKTQLAYTLSGGELQMLAIARALMSDPKILLLDEPSLGLAPMIIQDIFTIIKKIKEEGTTVVIVEQNALQTLKIADYAYVLKLGEISAASPAAELSQDARLIEAYLGGK